MSTSSRLAAYGVALSVAIYGQTSHAHSTFPTLIQSDLNMPCTPSCTICHRDNLGGFGTVVEPFGKSMQADGLSFVEASLAPTLNKLEQAGTDSDGDGIPDITELRAGEDPNGSLDLCSQAALAPRYGCGAHIAPRPSQDSGALLGALLTSLVLGAGLHRNAQRARARALRVERHTR